MGSQGFWCLSCTQPISQPGFADGKLCCSFCGRVVSEDNWSEEAIFVKDGRVVTEDNLWEEVAFSRTSVRDKKVVGEDNWSVEILWTKDGRFVSVSEKKWSREAISPNDGRLVSEDTWSEEVTVARDGRVASEDNRSEEVTFAKDAARQRLESKINYAVLDALFDESLVPQNASKSLFDNVVHESKTEEGEKDSKLSSVEFEDRAGDSAQGYTGEVRYGNVEEGYTGDYGNLEEDYDYDYDDDDDYGFEDY